jgi:hypothetical protein
MLAALAVASSLVVTPAGAAELDDPPVVDEPAAVTVEGRLADHLDPPAPDIEFGQQSDELTVISDGFAPDSAVAASIPDAAIEVGGAQTDGAGAVRVPFTVPRDLTAGEHVLRLEGTDADGALRLVDLSFDYTPNAAPDAADDTATTPMGTAVTIDVLANDSDADGGADALAVRSAAVDHTDTGITAIGDRTVVFSPAPGFTGTATGTYEVCDRLGACATAVFAVTVEPTPTTPTGSDRVYLAVTGGEYWTAGSDLPATTVRLDVDELGLSRLTGTATVRTSAGDRITVRIDISAWWIFTAGTVTIEDETTGTVINGGVFVPRAAVAPAANGARSVTLDGGWLSGSGWTFRTGALQLTVTDAA